MALREYSVAHIKPGCVLDRSMYAENLQLILPKGAEVTRSFTNTLDKKGITRILSDSRSNALGEDASAPVPNGYWADKLSAACSNGGRAKIQEELLRYAGLAPVIDDHFFPKTAYTLLGIFDNLSAGMNIDTQSFFATVREFASGAAGRECTPHLFQEYIHLHRLEVAHAVLTAIIIVATIKSLKGDSPYLERFVSAALLHDYGMMLVASDIREKPGPLTPREFEAIMKHPDRSVSAMDGIIPLPPDTEAIMRSHHERVDGEGYPAGLEAHEIPQEALLLGVASAFAALISPRPHRKALSPADSMCVLLDESTGGAGPRVFNKFARAFGLYPPGTIVQLDDGDVGIVSKPNAAFPARPAVKLLRGGAQGEPLRFDTLEMYLHRDKTIVKALT